jgi:hypothetical protein
VTEVSFDHFGLQEYLFSLVPKISLGSSNSKNSKNQCPPKNNVCFHLLSKERSLTPDFSYEANDMCLGESETFHPVLTPKPHAFQPSLLILSLYTRHKDQMKQVMLESA